MSISSFISFHTSNSFFILSLIFPTLCGLPPALKLVLLKPPTLLAYFEKIQDRIHQKSYFDRQTQTLHVIIAKKLYSNLSKQSIQHFKVSYSGLKVLIVE